LYSSFVQPTSEPVGGFDADASGPSPIRLDEGTHQRLDVLRNHGMNSKQGDAPFWAEGFTINSRNSTRARKRSYEIMRLWQERAARSE